MTDERAGLAPFFQEIFGCSPQVAVAVAGRARSRAYAPQALVLRQGHEGGETFVLVLGRAHALVYGRDGQVVLVRDFERGDIFGAICAAPPAPEPADIVAIEASRAAAFDSLDFLGLIEAHAAIGLAVSRLLLKQLHKATDKLLDRAILSAQGRVYAELLRLARLGDGHTLRPPPVLSALAVRVHTTRETASRAVAALERRGIARRDGEALVIVAPRRLEELVV